MHSPPLTAVDFGAELSKLLLRIPRADCSFHLLLCMLSEFLSDAVWMVVVDNQSIIFIGRIQEIAVVFAGKTMKLRPLLQKRTIIAFVGIVCCRMLDESALRIFTPDLA